MKTKMQRMALKFFRENRLRLPAGILVIFLLAGCTGNETHKNESKGNAEKNETVNSGPFLMAYPEEDMLDLNRHEMDTAKAHKEFNHYKAYIRLNNRIPATHLLDVFDTTALDFLRSQIDTSDCTGRYITVLRLHFALSADFNSLRLLYEPSIACWQSDSIVNDTVYGIYLVPAQNTYYKYANNQFTNVTAKEAMAAIGRYNQKVTIDCFRNGNFRNSLQSNDPSGAVKTVIFPFQEMDSLLECNQASSIKVHSAAVLTPNPNNPKEDSVIRHTLLVGPASLDMLHLSAITEPVYVMGAGYRFTDKYANLAHLCPPNCRIVKILVPQSMRKKK